MTKEDLIQVPTSQFVSLIGKVRHQIDILEKDVVNFKKETLTKEQHRK